MPVKKSFTYINAERNYKTPIKTQSSSDLSIHHTGKIFGHNPTVNPSALTFLDH